MNKVNINKLSDRKSDLIMLGASEESIKTLETKIMSGLPSFDISETRNIQGGHVNIIFPIKTNNPEKGYYFSNFKAQFYKDKPKEEGHAYFVVTPGDDGKNTSKKFENLKEGFEEFKNRKDSILTVGINPAKSSIVAERVNGGISITRDFRYYLESQQKPVEQTFYLQEGKGGFSIEQASHLVAGRFVFRNDLVSTVGIKQQAWLGLDMERGKADETKNYPIKPYFHPNYPFDLESTIKDYKIKFLQGEKENHPKNMTELITSFKNGDSPHILGNVNGEEKRLRVEAAVRFKTLNFFDMGGKPVKRELLLSKDGQAKFAERSKAKENTVSQAQGIER